MAHKFEPTYILCITVKIFFKRRYKVLSAVKRIYVRAAYN